MPARPISPRIAVSVVYVVAMFMAIMDSTIVNVALPTISRDLSVPLDRVDGVVVGFLVSLAVFIPASGWLGDRLGTRRVFLGLSALNAGLSTFPEALGVMAGAQIAGRIYPRFGPRRMMTGGMVGVAATTALMVTVGSGTGLWWIRGLMLLLGLSWAQALVPLQAAAFATITPAATGAASTLFNTGRQVGMAVGVAILTTVASAVGLTKHVAAGTAPHLAAYHAGLVAASVIALIAAGAAQFVDDRAAAATMRRPGPSRRRTTAAAHAISAGCHHPAITGHAPGDAARRHLAAAQTAEPR